MRWKATATLVATKRPKEAGRRTIIEIKLSELNGENGFRLDGASPFDRSGHSVSDAGDVNGDGIEDIIIGAFDGDASGDDSGESYVIFGRTFGFPESIDLSTLNGSDGFRIDGVDAFDYSGVSVSAAGDVNGDGIGDVIIGATGVSSAEFRAGESYVVFGSSGGFSASIDLSELNGGNGFRIVGADQDDRAGFSVSSAGDFNGDGIDDVIVGSPDADAAIIGTPPGVSYVVFGSTGSFSAAIELSTLDGNDGFRLVGIDGDVGYSVASAGDINGDGIDDVVIGAPFFGPPNADAGASYVVFGSTAGFASSIDISALDGSDGFRIDGIDHPDRLGASVNGAGDVNGDGIDDVVVGAPGASSNDGSTFVIFGSTGGFSSVFDASALDGTNGFRIDGDTINGRSGASVSAAGDFNGDTIDDIVIGTPSGAPVGLPGETYIIFGQSQGFQSAIDLSNLDSAQGLRIDGIDAGDRSGLSVSAAGDVNADGFDDIVIGASLARPNGVESGESYVVFGFSTNPSPGADTLVGSNGNDTIDGLGGADLIQGLEGADSLRGSAGKDTIEGGDGRDTLLGGGGNDDLDGGVGNDLLRGENGRDFLFGGAGADTLEGRNGNDTLEGGAGPDNLLGGVGEDTATYVNSASAVTVNLATGTGSGGHAQGDSLNSVENLIGSNLSDNLTGDGQANRIQGGNGNDTIDGANGNDRLFGDLGGDSMAGGLGNDTLIGGSGGDSMEGGDGADSLSGSDGSDTLRGGDLGDSLSGGLGEDELFGDGGNDILRGNNNPDLLDGGAGVDTLIGGNGSDTLVGGTGNDSLNGSAGLDRYVFRNGDGNDTISLFQDGLDTLDLSQHTSVNDFGDITKTQQGANLLVTFDGDDGVLIENFLDGNLTGDDFFFGA